MADRVPCKHAASSCDPQTDALDPRLIALVRIVARDAAEARWEAETEAYNETKTTNEESRP